MINIENLELSFSSVTNDEQPVISKEYFNENYGYPGIPVVFRKAFQQLKIRNTWTKEYLSGVLKEKERVEKSANRQEERFQTLSEYLQDQTQGFYYKTSRHLTGRLAQDYATPEIFNCWYADTKSGTPAGRLSWLYVGKENTYSDIHRDIWWSSAWNYLVSGTKVWFIYPAVYNDRIKEATQTYSIKSITDNNSNSPTNECRPLICIQQSGDLIFVPGNYYHAVYNMGETVSLTENFVNETNYDLVRSYFRTRTNKNNLYSIESIIKEGFVRKNF